MHRTLEKQATAPRRDVIPGAILLAVLVLLAGCPRRPPRAPARPSQPSAPARPSALPIDAAVSDIATGGAWQEGGRSGIFRVIVRSGGRTTMRSEVVLEWLQWDERGEQPTPAKSVTIDELARGGIVVTNSRIENEEGRTVVKLGLANPYTGAAGEARVWPAAIGKYRVKIKWAEDER